MVESKQNLEARSGLETIIQGRNEDLKGWRRTELGTTQKVALLGHGKWISCGEQGRKRSLEETPR